MSWLNKLTTKDGKLAPSTNGKAAKPGSRSVSPAATPNLPKINLPPADGPNYGYANGGGMPKVVLTQDDEGSSPMTVSPSSVHRADSMSPSQDSLGKPVGSDTSSTHRRYATIANDDIPTRARVQSEALPPPPSTTPRPRSRSNSVANADQNVAIPITDSPTQSVTSRRSGSIGSGESTQYPSIQQLVESPKSDGHGGVHLPVITDPNREANGSPPGKHRKNSRKHASSVGAASIASASSRFGKPPSRHQSTMGMGLASALVASGMGIAPPPSMLVSATGSLAPPVISKKASNVSINGRTSPERTRIVRPRRRSSGNSAGIGNGNNSGDDSEDYDSGDALSFGDDEIPITGFAVATMKRNQDFHELFPQVPVDDYLIDDYGCALQRDILIQGRLYISENHLCFHANIFGWVTDLIIPVNAIRSVEKKMTAFVIPNAICITEHNAKHTFASFLARDTAYDVIYSVWRNGGPSRSLANSPGSEDTPGIGSMENGGAEGGARVRKATQCACSKAGAHYPNVAMEVIIPGTPEQIYNLMFASGFIKDFLAKDQKLMDIQTSDWQPSPENQHLLSRNMSYIKPLSGGFGPKQTKCELRDENQHVDFNEYASTITTTRTPDVPSGGVFAVKTRTCIMWAGNTSTKVIVTFTVEWTGKSFVKGIIERSCNDGQRTYYSELAASMRKYIAEHRTEFLPEGVDAAAAAQEELEEAALSPTTPNELQPTAKPVAASRGLQWALDTFEAASKVATDSISGLFDIVSDLMGGAGGLSRTSVLGIVIALLLASNIYTIMTMGGRRAEGKRQVIERRESERERWVGDAVKAFIQVQQSINSGHSPLTTAIPETGPHTDGTTNGAAHLDVRTEIEELRRTVTQIEERLAGLKLRLEELD